MKDRLVQWLMHSHRMRWVTLPENAVLVHLTFGLLWLVPGSVVTLVWLSDMVAWVSWMSLYALVLAHWVGLQTALGDLRVKHQGESEESP